MINFQPQNSNGAALVVPDGYFADYGQIFGDRGNGYVYGWNCDLTDHARDRFNRGTQNSTLIILDKERRCSVDIIEWKIQVPNGQYRVTLIYSEPQYRLYTGGCTIQGVNASIGMGSIRYGRKDVVVNVQDGEIIAA